MAKAGLLFVGTDDGIVLYSEPGAAGRWLRIGQELRGQPISAVWTWLDNPTVVLASAGSTLLRSTDGGMSWSPLSVVAGGLLASAKANPALVYCLAVDGTLSQSHDAGATWVQVGARGVLPAKATLLVAARDDSALLFAVAGNLVFTSNDGGASWSTHGTLPAAVTGLALLPNGAGLYASADGILYQYSDARWSKGANTRQLTGPLALLAGSQPTLLAALESGDVGRSSDGGVTWEATGAEIGWGSGPQALIAAPYHMDIAFAGGGPAVALSVDRGRTWQRLKGEANMVRALAVARLV